MKRIFVVTEGAHLAHVAQRIRKENKTMDLKAVQIGERISQRLALTKAEIRKTKTAKSYLVVTLSDGSAELQGNIWDWQGALPQLGAYEVDASIGEYQGRKQLNNIKMHLSDNQDMSAFSVRYTDDVAYYEKRFAELLANIADTPCRHIVEDMYAAVGDAYKAASSAASMHHVGAGGNLVHTCEVAEMAKVLAVAARSYGYNVSMSLCIAGALVHDIGKIYTYALNGPVVAITLNGTLADHIALGARLLWSTASAKQNRSTAALLEHIILSHHGKQEYGSPVTPKFMEAYIVNTADSLSATLATVQSFNQKAVDERRPGKTTERIYPLGNTMHLLQSTVVEMLTGTYDVAPLP